MAVKVNSSKFVRFLVFVAVCVVAYGYFTGMFGRKFNKAEVPNLDKMDVKYVKEKATNVPKIPLPQGEEMSGKVFLKYNTYDWHGNTAVPFANGGAATLDDSLIGKEGLVVKIDHQDDTNVSIKEAVTAAEKYKASGGKSGGNIGFTIMGGASVPLIEPANELLKKIDPSYRFIGIDLVGKSDGEDQGIAPAEILTNPELARGKVFIGVTDDEDIFLFVQYFDKVGIPINFDYHTYNPNAVNFEHVSDFQLAGKRFIAGDMAAPRPIVDDNGRPTGKTSDKLPLYGLASWTPVDRNLERDLPKLDAAKYRSLATITSTGQGEQRAVMPTTLIVLNKYYEDNLEKFSKFSYAVHKAALQIDAYPDAFQRAMEYNTQIMGIWDEGDTLQNAAKKRGLAFKGYTAAGNRNLKIGGSAVFSFKDAMNMLGMSDSGDDLANSTFASVYRSVGNLIVRKYPEKNLKSFTPFEKFFDARALRAAYKRAQSEGSSATTELIAKREYVPESKGRALGSTSYQITFKTNSAKLDAKGLAVVQQIQDEYAGTEYPIQIVGHTDRTGTDARNLPLSKERADEVKTLLVSRNSRAFGGNRIDTDGKGSTEPPHGVDPNYQGECAQCRRVEIVIFK